MVKKDLHKENPAINAIPDQIKQDNLQAGCRDKNFPSPTILVDGEFIVYGGKTDSPDGMFSINMPNKHELETIIKKLI